MSESSLPNYSLKNYQINEFDNFQSNLNDKNDDNNNNINYLKRIKMFVSIDNVKLNNQFDKDFFIKFVNCKNPEEIVHLPISCLKVARSPVRNNFDFF